MPLNTCVCAKFSLVAYKYKIEYHQDKLPMHFVKQTFSKAPNHDNMAGCIKIYEMKNNGILIRLLLSSIGFFAIFFIVQLLLQHYKITSPITIPDIIIKCGTNTIVFFVLMLLVMKRRAQKRAKKYKASLI
jgi:hypothetical protein